MSGQVIVARRVGVSLAVALRSTPAWNAIGT
jgi:hypothetical protein